MFVIIALYSNTPCMDISFLRRKKRLQEIRRYLLKRKTSDPTCSHFTFSIDLLQFVHHCFSCNRLAVSATRPVYELIDFTLPLTFCMRIHSSGIKFTFSLQFNSKTPCVLQTAFHFVCLNYNSLNIFEIRLELYPNCTYLCFTQPDILRKSSCLNFFVIFVTKFLKTGFILLFSRPARPKSVNNHKTKTFFRQTKDLNFFFNLYFGVFLRQDCSYSAFDACSDIANYDLHVLLLQQRNLQFI